MATPPYSIKHLIGTLAAARKQQQLSQSQLGERLGLPQSHISDIEQGKKDLRLSTFIEIARLLGFELMLVPRQFVPAVTSLTEMTEPAHFEERSAYGIDPTDTPYD